MSSRPFHHGDLRNALLERAEQTLRDEGIEALSLRELARQVGVSHGAPRSHFIDRRALLDALAVRGFERLAEALRTAIDAGADYEQSLHAALLAYLEFAQTDAALMDLMFAAKLDAPTDALQAASEPFYDVIAGFIERGVAAGAFGTIETPRLTRLLAATMQGGGALLASRRITPEQGEMLITDVTALLMRGSVPPKMSRPD